MITNCIKFNATSLIRNNVFRCVAEHMGSVRAEVSTMLEKLLDKLTALEQYEATLVEIPQVTSVDQLPQVIIQ